jgi:hypothetical protein
VTPADTLSTIDDLACAPIAQWPARRGDVQFCDIFGQINAGAEGNRSRS